MKTEIYYTVGSSDGPWYDIDNEPHYCFDTAEEAAAELKYLRDYEGTDYEELDRTFQVTRTQSSKMHEWYPKQKVKKDE